MSSALSGGSGGHAGANDIQQLHVQNAQYNTPILIVYGQARIAANVIWAGGFVQVSTKAGGKGAGQQTPKISFTCAAIFSLCFGPVTQIVAHWNDGAYHGYRTLQDMIAGGWYFPTNPTGALPSTGDGYPGQPIWPYLSNKHPQFQLGYSNLALACNSDIQLGATPSLPQFNWEVAGFLQYGNGILDALPSAVIEDLMLNPLYGLGMVNGGFTPGNPQYTVGFLTEQFDFYCIASNTFISPVIDSQDTIANWLQQFVDIAHGGVVWSEGQLKFSPYFDQPLTGNGVTYTPDLTPVYNLGADDFVLDSKDDVPITVERKSPQDRFNVVDVEFVNRGANYKIEVAEAKSAGDIAVYTLRREPVRTYHPITSPGLGAWVAQLKLLWNTTVRNTYKFKLQQRYLLLDPLDIVSLTDTDSGTTSLGLNAYPVRITSITERAEDGILEVEAEDLGTNFTPGYGRQVAGGAILTNVNAIPSSVNTPAIFELTSIMTGGIPTLMIGVSGGSGNLNWGGAHIYYSEDNGVTFNLLGEVTIPATQGQIFAIDAYSGANPDTTQPMTVDLTESAGELFTISTPLAVLGNNLCWLGDATNGEFFSFDVQEASVGANQFVLGGSPDWASGTYGVGQTVVPLSGNAGGYEFIVITAGTTSGSAPTWPQSIGATVTDGSVVWQNDGLPGGLYRGLFDTAGQAWATGTMFCYLGVLGNLDAGVFQWEFPTRLIGTALQFKFTSFNATNSNEQDLSSVIAYSYTPTGVGYSSPTQAAGGFPIAFGGILPWAPNTEYTENQVVLDTSGDAELLISATNPNWNYGPGAVNHPGLACFDFLPLTSGSETVSGVFGSNQTWLGTAQYFTDNGTDIEIVSIGSGADTSSNTQIIAAPGAIVAGDMLFAQIVAVHSGIPSLTLPSGWSLSGAPQNSGSVVQWLPYKIATASEPSSYTFTFGASLNSNGYMIALRNTNGLPTGVGYQTGTSTIPSITAVYTSGANLVLGMFAWNSGSAVSSLDIGGESGSTTPAWSFVGATTADASLIWENIGPPLPYSTWGAIASTNITMARAKDVFNVHLDLGYAYTNRANNDQVQWQAIINSTVIAKGKIALQSGVEAALEDLRAIFSRGVKGYSGTFEISVQVRVINGSGNGIFQFVSITPVLTAAPQVQRSKSGSPSD